MQHSRTLPTLLRSATCLPSQDLNLEAFAKFLSEEWDFSSFMDFLTAQAMLLQPAKVVAIEWPKDERKGEQYAWIDLYKAMSVAEAVLGPRSAPVRERFSEFVMAAATQVGTIKGGTGAPPQVGNDQREGEGGTQVDEEKGGGVPSSSCRRVTAGRKEAEVFSCALS